MVDRERGLLLGVVFAGASLAVLLRDERASSFFAGLGAGAGAPFVFSFLRNSRKTEGRPPEAGESSDGENPDR
jgi:hypothetical protein